MGRPAREWFPGATYHIMSRGNRKGILFKEMNDYKSFIELMNVAKEKYPFILHAYCLMTNHIHLLIETREDPPWKIMQGLLSSYAKEFNNKYQLNGHLFEGRYTACLIKDEEYFVEVSRYIHMNPVKAFIVREPLDYLYSSYRNYLGRSEEIFAEYIETARVLSDFDGNQKEQYRIFVEERECHEEKERQIMKDMKENENGLPV